MTWATMADLNTTEILAAFIGLYFVAAGIGLLSERDTLRELMDELFTRPVLGFLAGLIAFSIGCAIVGVHNNWSSALASFVSLVGWISLAEGVLMLACRSWFLGLFTGWNLSPRTIVAFGVVTIAIGILLLIAAIAG